jgi:hypothetical protein
MSKPRTLQKSLSVLTIMFAAIFLMTLSGQTIQAQEEKEDNSGTNPIAFTNDFRMYTDIQSAPGDVSGTRTTWEFRKPVSQTWAVRMRAAQVSVSGGSGAVQGMGDIDARVLWTPHVSAKTAVALGVEGFFNTASEPLFGTGRTAIGPQMFFAWFNCLGPGTIFAPGFQERFDVGGDSERIDYNQSVIDLYLVWIDPNKKYWAIFDPQIVFDHEAETEFAVIDLEVGQMMFGPTSSYIHPGIGVGGDRPLDWSIEFGFKVLWR